MVKRNRAREARRAAGGRTADHHGGAGARSADGARAGDQSVPRPDPSRRPDAAPGAHRTLTELRRIAAPAQARELAARLLDARRRHPVAVVSVPANRDEPWIDAEEILAAVRGYAEVVVLPTDASSWALSDALPEGTQVYGGAGRVYPVGVEWTTDPQRSPLRFAYSAADGPRATERLISDALAMTAAAGPLASARPLGTRRASGLVSAVIEPSRAMVTLDDGGLATIWQELTVPDVTIGQIVAVGQRVTGTLDHENRLDVRAGLRRGARTVEHYRPDDVVLARVVSVARDVVRVELHPNLTVAVSRERVTTNPSDSLTSLFTKGEVVVARVAETDGVHPALRFDDVDDEDLPLEAPPLLQGGPPWLTVPEPLTWEWHDDADQTTESPAPSAGRTSATGARSAGPPEARPAPAPRGAVHTLSMTLDVARARVTELEAALEKALAATRDLEDLRSRVRTLEDENQRLQKRVQDQRSQLRNEKQRAQKADRERTPAQTVQPVPTGPLFLDEDDQREHDLRRLRHEIYTEWAARIPAADKPARPLARYDVGPGFLTSLAALEGVSRDKVIQVVVEVLTGLAEELDGRQIHPLRVGSAGNSPAVTRAGGWTCYRAALQRETPGARRLSYWRRGDEFELSRVVHHDDMAP